MKNIFSLLIVSLFLFSCKKDSLSPTIKGIEGTWEYEQYSGYPFTSAPLPPGNGRIIYIGSDRTFERRNFDTVITRSTYSLEEKKDCSGSEKYIFFKTTDPYFSESIITVKDDKLILSSSNCLADGGIVTYRKK